MTHLSQDERKSELDRYLHHGESLQPFVFSLEDESLIDSWPQDTIELIERACREYPDPRDRGLAEVPACVPSEFVFHWCDKAARAAGRVRKSTKDTDPVLAAAHGNTDLCLKGLENENDDDYSTIIDCIVLAALHGRIEVVKALLNRTGSAHRVSDISPLNGYNAVIACARSGHRDVLEILLEAGAVDDKCDEDGYTALHHAAMCGQEDICAVLISQAQSDPMRKTKSGKTALDVAKRGSRCAAIISNLTS